MSAGSGVDRRPEEIRTLVVESGYALDEVTRPALIHFDLWPGNIFVDGSRIVGLIDHERAFWGDPAAVASSPTASPGYGQ
jgi:aminoglycoside phosphotransferase (APT) family kinase protein